MKIQCPHALAMGFIGAHLAFGAYGCSLSPCYHFVLLAAFRCVYSTQSSARRAWHGPQSVKRAFGHVHLAVPEIGAVKPLAVAAGRISNITDGGGSSNQSGESRFWRLTKPAIRASGLDMPRLAAILGPVLPRVPGSSWEAVFGPRLKYRPFISSLGPGRAEVWALARAPVCHTLRLLGSTVSTGQEAHCFALARSDRCAQGDLLRRPGGGGSGHSPGGISEDGP